MALFVDASRTKNFQEFMSMNQRNALLEVQLNNRTYRAWSVFGTGHSNRIHHASTTFGPGHIVKWQDPSVEGDFDAAQLPSPRSLRLDPDSMRIASQLIPDSADIWFGNDRGLGLASVYDALINRYADHFFEIQKEVQTHFPHVRNISLVNVSNTAKEIAVTLHDETRIPAADLSEGLLYFLAFAALKYLPGKRFYLVEEPENGLHPSRIATVMALLRDLSKTSQVIVATHSPLVINELQGNEVTVVTRDPKTGTRAELLQDMPRFRDAMKVYLPGEYWINYCDGAQESPLREGTARQ
jgi:hypothetical protein